ncbi:MULTISPECIES: hypothetical protein [Leptotrichia]|uniref:hypothetical protein n=1 Tax=Leptotrichia TaxID=32067 RepID=UPI0015B8FC67|nr:MULTISPECIES: hypothetical protein [Leptotrichia]NWO18309.1 hypothetical protein [Leptotrichia sp. oral taxon 223]
MKKIIISMFLVFSMLGFSRFVERCEITSKGVWRNGVGYVNCVSLESGRHFNFTGVSNYTRNRLYVGNVYRVYFNGTGYNRLYLTGYEYLY